MGGADAGTGGVVTTGGPTTFINATISNNRADSDNNGTGAGGGIRVLGAPANLINTIVAGNFRGNGTVVDDINGQAVANFSLFGSALTANLVGTSANNQLNVNARLDALANNGAPIVGATVGPTGFTKVLQTHALLAGSPALDSGDDASAAGLATDHPHRMRGEIFTDARVTSYPSPPPTTGGAMPTILSLSGMPRDPLNVPLHLP